MPATLRKSMMEKNAICLDCGETMLGVFYCPNDYDSALHRRVPNPDAKTSFRQDGSETLGCVWCGSDRVGRLK